MMNEATKDTAVLSVQETLPLVQKKKESDEELPPLMFSEGTFAEDAYVGKSRGRKRQRYGDVALMQGILCCLLLASVFVLRWLNADFQAELIGLYQEKTHAPAEDWLLNLTQTIEGWFRNLL